MLVSLVQEIDLGNYANWDDAERVVVTLQTLYDDFSSDEERPVREKIPFFASMKEMRQTLRKPPVHSHLGIKCKCDKKKVGK